MSFSEDYTPQGEFNSGLAIIYMIDSLKKRRIMASLENDYHTRFKMNVEIMKLLLAKAKEKLVPEHIAYWQKAEECLSAINHAKNNKLKILKSTLRFFDYWEIFLYVLL